MPNNMHEILGLATNDELVDELFKRFENAVFVGRQAPDDVKQPHRRNCMWRYRGDLFVCMGMTANMTHVLNTEFEADLEPLERGEM